MADNIFIFWDSLKEFRSYGALISGCVLPKYRRNYTSDENVRKVQNGTDVLYPQSEYGSLDFARR